MLKRFSDVYKFHILSVGAIFFLVFLAYSHTAKFDFTALDDTTIIMNRVSEMDSFSKIIKFAFRPVFDEANNVFYRPVLNLSFFIDTIISGGEIGFYHYSNVLWHAAAVSILFIFLCVIGLSWGASLILSLIFALHPALVCAVAWVPGRNDILLAAFTLLSTIFFIKSLESKNLIFPFFMSAVLLLNFFTKETAVLAPAVFILYPFVFGVKIEKKKILTLAAFIFAVFLTYFILRHLSISQESGGANVFKIIRNIFKGLPATFWYIGQTFIAEKIILYPQIKMNFSTIFSGACIFSFLCAACLFFRKQISVKIAAFGFFWFALFLIPTYSISNSVFFIHRLYLPLAGLLITVSSILKPVLEKGLKAKIFFCAAAAVLMIFFAALSFKQSFFYKDAPSFWLEAVKETPNSQVVNLGVAKYYLSNKEPDKALPYALTALENSKKSAVSLVEVANVYNAKGDYELAIDYCNKALEIDKFNEYAHMNMSAAYKNLGDKEKAFEILENALKLIPKSKLIENRLEMLKKDETEKYIVVMKYDRR